MTLYNFLLLLLLLFFNCIYYYYIHLMYICTFIIIIIGLMSRVFINSQGDWSSIPDWVIPKTQKMVLDAALLNIQHYKVQLKGKVEQSREWSSNAPPHPAPYLSVVATEKGALLPSLTMVANFTYLSLLLLLQK